ncbi:hypothetical protein VMT65_21920 [Nocardia sp. CDC153]|uniref:hypothetical protein n=1 Tax=Nocardia sp. CDC153 TaxID=3112167 RepID=UPI002DB6D8A9|nr:hypothetical protein [Nocardia sp. CDC153]MEC3955710.1 hypothetical protein [Nocardia sp. CDC153]
MPAPEMSPTEVSVRQFVNDSGAQHRFVHTGQAQAMFATAPTLDYEELRRDLDTPVTDELAEDPIS